MKLIEKIVNSIHPYSNDIIRTYVKKLREEINSLTENREETWVREDVLHSELYSCSLSNGKTVNLDDILFGTESCNTRQNIIVVVGERHIGKKYFVTKLLDFCSESLEEEGENIEKGGKYGNYRIPLVVNYQRHIKDRQDFVLEDLIVRVIEEKCIFTDHSEKRKYLKIGIQKLLSQGRFVIYFEGKEWLTDWEQDLKKIFPEGIIVKNYIENARHRNIAILTIDSETDIKESFLTEDVYTSIRLNKLTEKERDTYLREYLPNLLLVSKKDETIMEILRYPEHLKMFEELYRKNLIETDHNSDIKNEFDFYDFFIRANIRKKLSDVGAAQGCKEDKIISVLQQYAVDLYFEKKKNRKDPSQLFVFSDFREAGILNQDDEFVFSYCGYYLAAKYMEEEVKADRMTQIPDCLLEEPLEKILIWTGRLLDHSIEELSKFWKCLKNNHSCKLLLLAKVAKATSRMETFIEDIYKKAFLSLQRDFYDYSVLETFKELGDAGSDYLKKRYLDLSEYNENQANNIKKRLVYFLGISNSGIIDKMLDDLMAEETDQHLKYHIIRAAVENYNKHPKSTEFIKYKFEQLEEYCTVSQDPIIRSDFSILYMKYTNMSWMSPNEEGTLLKELERKMEDSIYWVRAHAAGAIGRKRKASAYHLLLQRIREELQFIYDKEKNYKNSIKVISYSVEAICELSNYIYKWKGDAIFHLAEFLDMSKLGDPNIEDAYATIATGIEYMISQDSGKLPFNLGGRFRNRTIKHKKVLLNMFQGLEIYFDEDQEGMGAIREKRKRLEKLMDTRGVNAEEVTNVPKKIKILQLSDLHFKEENSDNNLILQAVKNIQGIDLMIVTGDLKQFNESYDNTLHILRQLTEGLGIKPKDVFMVPGNHDCDDYDHKKEIIQDIRQNIYKEKEICKDRRDVLYQGMQSYMDFLEQFYGEEWIEQGGVHNKMLLWENCLHIVTMNTALLCDEHTSEDKLVDIGEMSRIEKNDKIPVLCISHHPMEQLSMDHQDTVKRIFKNLHVSAMFSGDIHRSKKADIYVNPYTIPNYIIGKFLGETSDQWSIRNIAIYEIDFIKKTLTPDLYKWERSDWEPDSQFYQKSDKLGENQRKSPIKLR